MKKILVTGLCTLHMGRLQYGNIGNYYIVEPLFRQLHNVFPGYEIMTTFQMTEDFSVKEKVTVLPIDLYYTWNVSEDIERAMNEMQFVEQIISGETKEEPTGYLAVLMNCDCVINVSGDMWGDRAEPVGHKRMFVDCMKMQCAQKLGKKTILYAVTPGPFEYETELAKQVFEAFDLVIVREKISILHLKEWGFSLKNVVHAPCPSFLFEEDVKYRSRWTKLISEVKEKNIVVGLTFGGLNMPVGPYDLWPRDQKQFDEFKDLLIFLIKKKKVKVVFFSHTNGFEKEPEFRLINGRDFRIMEFFYNIMLQEYPEFEEKIFLINEPLLPKEIKKVIGMFDFLITGRVHASVVAISQYIPTMFIEYDHAVVQSDKMTGFSSLVNMEEFVCDPRNSTQMEERAEYCIDHLTEIGDSLKEKIPIIKEEAKRAFLTIRNVIS